MTSTPAHSGMPEHFGIRITDADKDKLVGELDVDDRPQARKIFVFDSIVVVRNPGGTLSPANLPPRSSANAANAPPCTWPLLFRWCQGGLPGLLCPSMWGGARSSCKPQYTARTESLPQ